MSDQALIVKMEECPACRGRGYIRTAAPEEFIPQAKGYAGAKLAFAFVLALLLLSPALLGLYWESLLSLRRP